MKEKNKTFLHFSSRGDWQPCLMLLAMPQLLWSSSPCTMRSHHCVLTKSQAYWVLDACCFPPYQPSLTPCTKPLQSCLTLSDPMDHCSSGSLVHGILQARILGWVAMPSSRGFSQPRDWTQVSFVSCISRWVLYHSCHLGSPNSILQSGINS